GRDPAARDGGLPVAAAPGAAGDRPASGLGGDPVARPAAPADDGPDGRPRGRRWPRRSRPATGPRCAARATRSADPAAPGGAGAAHAGRVASPSDGPDRARPRATLTRR